MSESRLSFRPDIEGLRAVAVMLVIAAHAGLQDFSAGFIGVDLFFVISGYLISGLLLVERARSGRVDLPAFYARRVRRLLPALAAMLVVTALAAAALLAPMEQPAQADAATFVPLWLSNVYFAFHRLGYFDGGVGSNLFLHTWSLGVEEQFYLFWPALLLVLAGAWRGRARPGGDRAILFRLAVLAVVAFAVGVAAVAMFPIGAFYSLPARVWQFALGAVVYCLVAGGSPTDVGLRRAGAWAGVVGLALLAFPLLTLSPASRYPGWNALAPTLAAGLLLLGGGWSPDSVVARGLSSRWLGVLGKVSYGWYLWHWPVLVLGRDLWPHPSPAARLALVLVSLLAAFASHRWIERPIRSGRVFAVGPKGSLAVGVGLMLALALGGMGWSRLSQGWSETGPQAAYLQAKYDLPAPYASGCDEWYFSSHLRPCVISQQGAGKIVLIGDSVGMQWQPALAKMFPQGRWQFVALTKSSCPIVDRPLYYGRIGREYTECARWREQAIAFIEANHPEFVIVGSSSEYALGEQDWILGSRAYFDRLAASARHVVVLAPTPILPRNPLVCLARAQWRERLAIRGATCDDNLPHKNAGQVGAWLVHASEGYGNVGVLSMNDLVCPGGKCPATADGQLVYRDEQHLSTGFVESLAPRMAERMFALVNGRPPPSPGAASGANGADRE